MFLRSSTRRKNGKPHTYWSIVENKRVGRNRVVQRHVLYLGEISMPQQQAWQEGMEVFAEGEIRTRDLGGTAKTSDFANAIIDKLQ